MMRRKIRMVAMRGSSTPEAGAELGPACITAAAVPAGGASSIAPPAARRRFGAKQGETKRECGLTGQGGSTCPRGSRAS